MKLFFRKFGEEPSVLIILHGLFGSSDNWLSLAKTLSQDHTVYLIDQRNHGQSPHSDLHNYQAMSEDLNELMTDEKISSAVILGHSMGGKTAMRFAINFPKKVSKLIVVDIGPKYYPVHHKTILDALLSVDLNAYNSRKEVEDFLLDKLPEPEVRQFLLKNIFWNEDKRMQWRMNLQVLNKEIENIGEAITENTTFKGPSLFLKAEKSDYITEKDYVNIHRLFCPSIIECIPETGHWIQAEAPEVFLDSISAFLKAPQFA
jgi:esterase